MIADHASDINFNHYIKYLCIAIKIVRKCLPSSTRFGHLVQHFMLIIYLEIYLTSCDRLCDQMTKKMTKVHFSLVFIIEFIFVITSGFPRPWLYNVRLTKSDIRNVISDQHYLYIVTTRIVALFLANFRYHFRFP